VYGRELYRTIDAIPKLFFRAQSHQVVISFDPVTASDRSTLHGTNYATIDRGIDAWYGDNHLSFSYGGTSVSAPLSPADTQIVKNLAGGTFFYRILRDGAKLTIQYSSDGTSYKVGLSASLSNPDDDFNELLLATTTYTPVGGFADYASVTLTAIPPATALLGNGATTNTTILVAEPVNSATGNYFTSHTDLTVPGRGLSFVFAHRYNSKDTYNGPLGVGWTHPYNYLLSVAAQLAR